MSSNMNILNKIYIRNKKMIKIIAILQPKLKITVKKAMMNLMSKIIKWPILNNKHYHRYKAKIIKNQTIKISIILNSLLYLAIKV